jgi:ribosome-binding protein aMBF1 (putative translation factor)
VKVFDNPSVTSDQVMAVLGLLGERIKSSREKRGWSQEGLADEAEIPRNKYGAIERAKSPLPG